MKLQRIAHNGFFITVCTIPLLSAGCITDDPTFVASTEGPIFALIGLAGDWGRQLLAAFLF